MDAMKADPESQMFYNSLDHSLRRQIFTKVYDYEDPSEAYLQLNRYLERSHQTKLSLLPDD